MKLTEPQKRALLMMCIEPRETTRSFHGRYVAGSTAEGLIRRDLAKRVFHERISNLGGGLGHTTAMVGITDAGREALKANGLCPHPARDGHHETYLGDGQLTCRACGVSVRAEPP